MTRSGELSRLAPKPLLGMPPREVIPLEWVWHSFGSPLVSATNGSVSNPYLACDGPPAISCAAELSYDLGIYGQPRPASAIHFLRFCATAVHNAFLVL